MESVSWNDVKEFIETLNQIEGTDIYRLPTEAEREYACKAGSTMAFANGDITETAFDYDPNLDAIGWYYYNSTLKTYLVAQKKPNAWGLYDMHGNVWEWCEDWYEKRYASTHVRDPEGPSFGKYRVYRGGSCLNGAMFCRSALGERAKPDSGSFNLGFRLVMDLY